MTSPPPKPVLPISEMCNQDLFRISRSSDTHAYESTVEACVFIFPGVFPRRICTGRQGHRFELFAPTFAGSRLAQFRFWASRATRPSRTRQTLMVTRSSFVQNTRRLLVTYWSFRNAIHRTIFLGRKEFPNIPTDVS